MEVVLTTGAVSGAKLQSNHHHQQTNIQFDIVLRKCHSSWFDNNNNHDEMHSAAIMTTLSLREFTHTNVHI